MVIFNEIVIGAFLCMALSEGPRPIQANPPCPPTEDLQDEYYNVTPTMTDKFVPQDKKDATVIHDSDKSKTTIARILTHREKMRRYAINLKMAEYSSDHTTRWFPDTYEVGKKPFEDCCYALIEKESNVLGSYLRYFMENRDEKKTGLGMVLTKDTQDMITIFNYRGETFKASCQNFADPYKTLIENWSKQKREPLENDELNHDIITKDANALNTEHNNGGWNRIRTELERILFQKSIKHARAVMTEFEKLNNGKAIEDIISSYGFNELAKSLASIYGDFARYIKNRHKFIAEILFQYSDGRDYWATWNMCMAVVHPLEWPKIDDIFKNSNNGTSLTKFITEKKNEKIMAEMMAVIIDPAFQPTYQTSVPPTTTC